MIFVTIGSAVRGIEFIRLIKKMDEIAGKITEEVIMQIGTIDYKPKNAQFFKYASYQENLEYFKKASLIVGHCGIGTVLNALKFKKPIIVVPRRIQYGELNKDDHQIEIAQKLDGKELIEVVYNTENLEIAIKKMLARVGMEIKGEPNFEKDELVKIIKEFVKSNK